MRFPLSWLKTWVDLPPDLDALSRILMRAGIVLETVESPGAALGQVVVVEVKQKRPHPNAERLSLCTVSDGLRDYSIVCGAPNVAEGLKVPLAKEGAELPGGFKIKKSKIRGVESEGMLCSAEELGFPKGVDGLLVLDPGLTLGAPLAEALGLDDTVLTLETTANRPDHLSLRGLARELSALGGLALKDRGSDFSALNASAPAAASAASAFAVTVESEACSYYSARRIQGVKVGPSPAWLRERLEKSGIRSISNVVDATNYVLLERGQPLHAFDAARLSGGKLEARLARPGERIRTLDSQDRVLDAEDVVVADAVGAQALGGVMGGEHSQVGAATTDLVLEAAVFPPRRVRRTVRRLGLASESSRRFEHGVDPFAVDEALDRCASLVLELAGGNPVGERLSAGSRGEAPAIVWLEPDRVNRLLGTKFTETEMVEMLRRRFFTAKAFKAADFPDKIELELGAKLSETLHKNVLSKKLWPLPGAEQDSPDFWMVVPPSWRRDIKESVDLAEEVLQLAGVDSVPGTDLDQVRAPDPDDALWTNAWLLRQRFSALGLSEATALSYLDPALAQAWGMADLAPRMDNPLSAELSLLRPSLLPGLVDCALGALRRRGAGVALFELGRAFQLTGKAGPGSGIKESERVAVVLAGQASAGQWNAPGKVWDFYDLKGMAEALGLGLDLTFRVSAQPGPPAWAHPGRCAAVSIGGLTGLLAALHPALLKALDAPKGLEEILVLELEPQSASKDLAKEPRYAAFARVPSIERDLSCLMDSALEAGRILDFIKNEGGLGVARVLDRFEGAPLPPGRKSLTFRLTYAAGERSLTDVEVNQRHEELLQRLETALPVEVRR